MKMQKWLYIFVLFCAVSLSAAERPYLIEMVVLNDSVEKICKTFIGYASACEYRGNYPTDNVLSFFAMVNYDRFLPDSVKRAPVVEFYPDELSLYRCDDVKYYTSITMDSTQYKIYIIIRDTWPDLPLSDFFTPTGHYINFYRQDNCFHYEYDPPFVRWWCVGAMKDKLDFRVQWGISKQF